MAGVINLLGFYSTPFYWYITRHQKIGNNFCLRKCAAFSLFSRDFLCLILFLSIANLIYHKYLSIKTRKYANSPHTSRYCSFVVTIDIYDIHIFLPLVYGIGRPLILWQTTSRCKIEIYTKWCTCNTKKKKTFKIKYRF